MQLVTEGEFAFRLYLKGLAGGAGARFAQAGENGENQ